MKELVDGAGRREMETPCSIVCSRPVYVACGVFGAMRCRAVDVDAV